MAWYGAKNKADKAYANMMYPQIGSKYGAGDFIHYRDKELWLLGHLKPLKLVLEGQEG